MPDRPDRLRHKLFRWFGLSRLVFAMNAAGVEFPRPFVRFLNRHTGIYTMSFQPIVAPAIRRMVSERFEQVDGDWFVIREYQVRTLGNIADVIMGNLMDEMSVPQDMFVTERSVRTYRESSKNQLRGNT